MLVLNPKLPVSPDFMYVEEPTIHCYWNVFKKIKSLNEVSLWRVGVWIIMVYELSLLLSCFKFRFPPLQ